MKNSQRLSMAIKDLRRNDMGMVANILIRASMDVPEYGEEISTEEQFNAVIREVLLTQCHHYGKGIDPELSARLKSQSQSALALFTNKTLFVYGPIAA
jgi:hypothetical protein